MSIWMSMGEPVRALNGRNDAANYRAEGELTAYVDVAIADGYHDHIRLSVWDDADKREMTVVLSPEAARKLCYMLGAALSPPSAGAVVWGEGGESLDLEPAPEGYEGETLTVTWDSDGRASFSGPAADEEA